MFHADGFRKPLMAFIAAMVERYRNHPALLGYYTCPAMCGQVLDAAFWSLSQVELEPGEDYRILNVSIDPKEDAGIAKQRKAALSMKH